MSARGKEKILGSYKGVKNTPFDFERIPLLFEKKEKTKYHQVIADRTLQDLDFEELFTHIDRTCSKVGQQYLYYVLRTIPEDSKRSLHFEKVINYFDSNLRVKEQVVLELDKLNGHGAYFIQRLIHGKNLVKPSWFWIIPFLSGFSFATLMLSFVYPVYPFFILILAVNFVIHFWNKNNILSYANTVPQLIRLKGVARKLVNHPEVLEENDQFQKSFNSVNKITKKAVFLSWESMMSSEIGQVVDYFLELLKASFLLEPIIMFRIIQALEVQKQDIERLLDSVGKVDVAISISSFREDLPYFTRPVISNKGTGLRAEEMFHPLIVDPVSNTIKLSDRKSALISGSNMSGKTTFIRTIGINTILSQTINTACAKCFEIPLIKIHSAVRIADDIMNETSYYYEEVKVIKQMIEASETDDQNLFLLDELFKGTNTFERVASGKAVLSYLNQKGNMVFASTHDLELTDLLSETYNFYHFEESVEEDALIFDYQLKDGKWTNTNAIRILEVNGFPKEVTEEARSMAQKIKREKGPRRK